MRDPSKKQMQYVIDKFKTILPLAKLDKQLDMDEHRITQESKRFKIHKCGTVHCAMGWYGVANKNRKAIRDGIKGGYCGYSTGIILMARDLGFHLRSGLIDWARDNPGKWGNDKGQFLDCSETAYGGAKNMGEIVEFLEKVKERL